MEKKRLGAARTPTLPCSHRQVRVHSVTYGDKSLELSVRFEKIFVQADSVKMATAEFCVGLFHHGRHFASKLSQRILTAI